MASPLLAMADWSLSWHCADEVLHRCHLRGEDMVPIWCLYGGRVKMVKHPLPEDITWFTIVYHSYPMDKPLVDFPWGYPEGYPEGNHLSIDKCWKDEFTARRHVQHLRQSACWMQRRCLSPSHSDGPCMHCTSWPCTNGWSGRSGRETCQDVLLTDLFSMLRRSDRCFSMSHLCHI